MWSVTLLHYSVSPAAAALTTHWAEVNLLQLINTVVQSLGGHLQKGFILKTGPGVNKSQNAIHNFL